MTRPRILLADDHSVILAGIESLIESYAELIGTVNDGRSLVEMALELKPDLIILDIGMPVLNGIDAARQIRKEWPTAKLLFLTMHTKLTYLQAAIAAGASGYVLKSSAAEELQAAIRKVLKGETYLPPELGLDALEVVQTASGRKSRATAGLTDRQREVLQLIGEGRTNKEIAQILKVSVKTVEFHRGRIMHKLRIHTPAELGVLAVREDLLPE